MTRGRDADGLQNSPSRPCGHSFPARAREVGSVARERKLSDRDVARLRVLHDEGWPLRDLAAEFDVSRQHAGRLVRGDQRPAIAGLDAEALRGGVSRAVTAYLADVDLDSGDGVLAVTAQALASKLDDCIASDSAAAAQAVPRLAAQLVDVLERLRGLVPREADGIDRLRQRRSARRLAMAASNGGGAP
jgi:hypothetical protein